MKGLALESVHIKNFKAIADSGPIKLGPLTVLIGENGSGKSSLIEALATLQQIVIEDLDHAMAPWRGFDEIWHQGSPHEPHGIGKKRDFLSNPMMFKLKGRGMADDDKQHSYKAEVQLTREPVERRLVIMSEAVELSAGAKYVRDDKGRVTRTLRPGQKGGLQNGGGKANGGAADPIFHRAPDKTGTLSRLPEDESLLSQILYPAINDWQFVNLVPSAMGGPTAMKESGAEILLDDDGGNVAEYLADIKRIDERAFRGIVETLQYILPYAADLTTPIEKQITEPQVYLKMSEAGFSVPGWLLSHGTIRILAILALLRHPKPQPLIVIEEIENGLDPRALQLIVEEIRTAVESQRVQVIATTHSPYLLNLMSLDQIVLVERIGTRATFRRPADMKSIEAWAKRYAPGELYTMGVFQES